MEIYLNTVEKLITYHMKNKVFHHENINRLALLGKPVAYIMRIVQDALIYHLFKAQLSSSSRAST
jgi:hypothetical protein